MADEEVKNSLGDVKFNSQAYLNSYLDEITNVVSPNYSYISTLDTSPDNGKSLPECLALLNGKSESNPIANLKTYQYNSLIPKIRLYRVNYDNSEYEFIFNKDHRYTNTSILNGNFIVGNNCGIKSINWILAGTNPVSAEKTIEVKIEFYFDSIAAFSGGSYDSMLNFWNGDSPNLLQSDFDDQSKSTTTNYWSLIYHPGKKPDEYDTTLFRIKAIVGWESIDPLIAKELFKNNTDINEKLLDSELVMYLNLVQHNFAFNEDGSIKLTANYIASIENSFSSTRYDLLKGLKESLLRLKDFSYATLYGVNQIAESQGAVGERLINAVNASGINSDLTFEEVMKQGDYLESVSQTLSYNQLENRIKFLSYLNNNNGKIKDLIEEYKSCTGEPNTQLDVFLDLKLDNNKKLQDVITKFNETLQTTEQELQKASTNLKLSYYSRLLQKLVNVKNNKTSIYFITIDKQQVNEWLKWKNGLSLSRPPFRQIPTQNKIEVANELAKELNNASLQRVEGDELEFFEGAPESFNEYSLQQRLEEEKIDNKSIVFTTVGHIIDAAFDVINGLISNNELQEFIKNKLILSTFSTNKSFASVPIHMSYLIKFMNEILYERGATQLSLFDFIKELCVKVIEPALETRETQNSAINKYANVSISSTIVSLGLKSSNPQDEPLKDYIDSNKVLNLKSASISSLKSNFLTNSNKNKGLAPYNYFIIYDRFNKDFKGVGDKIKDERKGIYHFTVAQDYGLVKSINFKKIDQPFLKESKSVGKKTIYLGQFRDLYNADIKMIGNNLFHPGMMLFIKPTVEFGNVISTNSAYPTFAQITGVGGYYTVVKVTSEITDESYTTTLDCVFHSNDGLQPDETEKPCNYTELQKAGIYNQETGMQSEISPYFISLLEQIKKDDEEERRRREGVVGSGTAAILGSSGTTDVESGGSSVGRVVR